MQVIVNQLDAQVIDLLPVEDSPGDASITREARDLSRRSTDCTLWTMEYRHGFFAERRKYSAVSTPGILLFDLNLPRESRLEGLRPKSRTSDSIRGLTKSKAEDDMEKSYGLHANCYVPKPVELAKLADAVQGMRDFWLCLVTPPLEKK